MLPRASRMRRGDDFREVIRGGSRGVSRPLLVVHAALRPSGPAAPPVVGFVVGKSVGVAVVRNRVKRRLRAAVRESLAELPFGARVVVRALPDAASADWRELRRAWERGITKALVRERELCDRSSEAQTCAG